MLQMSASPEQGLMQQPLLVNAALLPLVAQASGKEAGVDFMRRATIDCELEIIPAIRIYPIFSLGISLISNFCPGALQCAF